MFTAALADAVTARGGHIVEGVTITGVDDAVEGGGVGLVTEAGPRRGLDSVVLANGAWLSQLARAFGVRQPAQAGRGYSFEVAAEHLPAGPVYFPVQRPLAGKLHAQRIASGTTPAELVPFDLLR